jgi:hypothetical protein
MSPRGLLAWERRQALLKDDSEADAAFRAAWRRSSNDAELGQRLGLSRGTVIATRQRLGLKSKHQVEAKMRHGQFIAAIESTKTDAEAARLLRVRESQVRQFRKDNHIPLAKTRAATFIETKRRLLAYVHSTSDIEAATTLRMRRGRFVAWRRKHHLPQAYATLVPERRQRELRIFLETATAQEHLETTMGEIRKSLKR